MGHGNRNGLKRGETNSPSVRPRWVCLPALPLMAVDSSFTEREKGAGKEGGGKKEIRKVRGELWEKKREEEMTRLKDPLGKQRKGSERKRKGGMRKKKKRAEEVRVALKRNEEEEEEAVFKSFLRLPKCSVGPTNLRRQPFNGLNNFYELEQDRSSWRMAIDCQCCSRETSNGICICDAATDANDDGESITKPVQQMCIASCTRNC